MTNLVAEANVANGTFIHREATPEEIEREKKFQAEAKAADERQALEDLELAAAKRELLDKLGITEEEAKLLLK